MHHMASIGIIGGADGPTVIFLAGENWTAWAASALAAGAIILFFWLRRRNKR